MLVQVVFYQTRVRSFATNDCCLVDLIYVTLACEDANSKLVEVVTFADVDAEKRVDTRFGQDFEVEVHARFSS